MNGHPERLFHFLLLKKKSFPNNLSENRCEHNKPSPLGACCHPGLPSEWNCSQNEFLLHEDQLIWPSGPGWAPDLRTASPYAGQRPWWDLVWRDKLARLGPDSQSLESGAEGPDAEKNLRGARYEGAGTESKQKLWIRERGEERASGARDATRTEPHARQTPRLEAHHVLPLDPWRCLGSRITMWLLLVLRPGGPLWEGGGVVRWFLSPQARVL